MTHASTPEKASSSLNVGLILLIAVAIVGLMLVLTAVFGVYQTGPFYDIVPDPAGWAGLPF